MQIGVRAVPHAVASGCFTGVTPRHAVGVPCNRRGQFAVAFPGFPRWIEDVSLVFVKPEDQQRKGTSTQMRADAGRAARARRRYTQMTLKALAAGHRGCFSARGAAARRLSDLRRNWPRRMARLGGRSDAHGSGLWRRPDALESPPDRDRGTIQSALDRDGHRDVDAFVRAAIRALSDVRVAVEERPERTPSKR